MRRPARRLVVLCSAGVLLSVVSFTAGTILLKSGDLGLSLFQWVMALFALLWVVALLVRWRRHHTRGRRRREGRCLSCGYDVRASPERCPECGAAATTS